MNLRHFSALGLAIVISTSALAQDTKPTTPEERTHWVEVLHKLEAQPSDQSTISEAERVVKRLIEAPDFHMTICPVITELPPKYAQKEAVLQLFMIGLAGYQVETGKTDNEGANLYALHSVLKGYAVLVQQNARATDKKLDELAKLDADGKLPELIKKKGCK